MSNEQSAANNDPASPKNGLQMRFGIRSLMLAIAFAGVWFAGIAASNSVIHAPSSRIGEPPVRILFVIAFAAEAPLWLPFAALAFAIGRCSVSVPLVIIFALGEIAAVAALNWALQQ